MKKILLLSVFMIISLFSSCSNEDSIGTSSSNFSTPLTIGNYWTYNVEAQAATTRDSLYISNDTIISANTYKKFKTKNNSATGFYSSALRNNAVRLANGKLLLSGDLSFGGAQTLPIAIDLTLNDFVIFNKDATNDQALNTTPKSGSINQTVNGYPLTINYSLQSYGGETLTTFTSPNQTIYTNVKSTKIKLRVSATTLLSGIQIPVLNDQEVLVSTQYLADGIGVVYTKTDTSYTLNSTVASTFGIPATDTQTQNEFLDTYVVN